MTLPIPWPAQQVTHITSRDNPLLKALRKLSQDAGAYRTERRVWLEGDHLCRAAMQRAVVPCLQVVCESNWPVEHMECALSAIKTVVLPDLLFRSISGLESPARIAFVLDLGAAPGLLPTARTVLLDRVQDAGNVGSILRSAAAFGFEQVLAIQGTAGLWSPKVLRSGMGAHFALRLVEGLTLQDIALLAVPLVVTSSHAGTALGHGDLPQPCAWVFGHEGQGVDEALLAAATRRICIEQPGGEESLNVAAAAAICLHASRARG